MAFEVTAARTLFFKLVMLGPNRVTFWKILKMASKMCMKLTQTDLRNFQQLTIYKVEMQYGQ